MTHPLFCISPTFLTEEHKNKRKVNLCTYVLMSKKILFLLPEKQKNSVSLCSKIMS